MIRRIGNVHKDEKLNQNISPVFHVVNIAAPLIIVQGANDPRVKRSETDTLVALMIEQNVDVEYNLYHDEGHNILRPVNRFHLFRRIEIFLAEHLGGLLETRQKMATTAVRESTIKITFD